MKLEVMKISDFTHVVTGGTPSTSEKSYWDNGNVPWLNSGELNKGLIQNSENFITPKGLQNSSAKMMPIDTVLIALTGATTGKVALLAIEACANQSVTGILPSKRHLPKFLYYYLISIRQSIVAESYGGAQKHISQAYVKDLMIPLPSLLTQEHITTVLDKADTLRKKNLQLMQYYDDLAQSLFIDMFGDPIKNEMGWNRKELKEIGSLDRGVSKHRPRNAPELLGGQYPLVQTGDVANSGGVIKQSKSTYSDLGLRQSKLWPKGTLCITIAANIAKTGILNFPACFPDSIVGFTPNELSNTHFVQFIFSFLQRMLEDLAPESAQKNINLVILRGLKVIVPPIELQNLFAIQIQNIERQKEKLKAQMQETENLFQALMQKAFS